jgi:hypothetical protein
VSASYWMWRYWLTESINLLDGKLVHGVIRNYCLPRWPPINFLNHMEWKIIIVNPETNGAIIPYKYFGHFNCMYVFHVCAIICNEVLEFRLPKKHIRQIRIRLLWYEVGKYILQLTIYTCFVIYIVSGQQDFDWR